MKKLVLLLPFLLSGCFDDTNEIRAHIANVQANTTTHIEPMPEVPVFNHYDYEAQKMRSPFDLPNQKRYKKNYNKHLGV